MTYPELIDKLKRGEQFSFSRWGDGEWNAVLGRSGENCDGHKYFPDMGQRLKAILESKPDYHIGMQPLALRLNQEDKDFQRLYQMNEWCDAEIIYKRLLSDGLDDLFEALEVKEVGVIGNKRICNWAEKMGFAYLEVPSKNAWLEYKEVKDALDFSIGGKFKWDNVILYCAGMMSNVLIDDFKDAGVTQIDIGSAFDPLCGVYSRGAYRKLHEQGRL